MGNTLETSEAAGENLWHNLLHSDARSCVRAWLDPVTAIALRRASKVDLADPHPDTWVISALIEKLEPHITHLLPSRTWYETKTMESVGKFNLVSFYYGHHGICHQLIDKMADEYAAVSRIQLFGHITVATRYHRRWWTNYLFMILVFCRHVELIRYFKLRLWIHVDSMFEFLKETGAAAIEMALTDTKYKYVLYALLEGESMAAAVIRAGKRQDCKLLTEKLVRVWLEWQLRFLTTGELDEEQRIWAQSFWNSMKRMIL